MDLLPLVFESWNTYYVLYLQTFQVSILTNSDCQKKVPANETIQTSMICAGGSGSGTSKVGLTYF